MKISFSNKFDTKEDLVIIYKDKNDLIKKIKLSNTEINLIEKVEKSNRTKKSFTEFFNISEGKEIKKILISKIKSRLEISNIEALAGGILNQLERNNIEKATVICSVDSNRQELFNVIKALSYGFLMKD